jgi:hypothetical protein
MPAAIITNTITAITATAIVAAASLVGVKSGPAYEDGALKSLTQAEASSFAESVFQRADMDGDGALDVDEFAALTIVTAELAHLNGFFAVEKAGALETIALPINAPAALGDSEQTRIDAVARYSFYAFAGSDGKMQQGEYSDLQEAIFASSDLNANGALTSVELSLFAQRQAYLRPEV